MSRNSGVLPILGMVLLISACAPFMVPVREVDTTHDVYGAPTKEQVREAIMEGAKDAGWRVKDWGDDKLLASYTYGQHTINLEIDYSDSFYVTRYHSSNRMKMFCTEQDKKAYRGMVVSGQHACPGDRPPAYIHKSYKEWTDSLNRSIQFALGNV